MVSIAQSERGMCEEGHMSLFLRGLAFCVCVYSSVDLILRSLFQETFTKGEMLTYHHNLLAKHHFKIADIPL